MTESRYHSRYRGLDPMREPWTAQPENTVGGWCVTMSRIPGTPADGNPPVCDFVNQELAEHVAKLHNDWLEAGGRPVSDDEPTIEELIERSSLGTPAARALRARTTPEEVERVRERMEQLRRTGCPPGCTPIRHVRECPNY